MQEDDNVSAALGLERAGSSPAPYRSMPASELIALLEHRDRQIEAIRRTGDALFSHPNVNAMVRATLEIALDVLRADAGTVFLHEPETNSLVFRYVVGPAARQLMGTSIPAERGESPGQCFAHINRIWWEMSMNVRTSIRRLIAKRDTTQNL